MIWKIKIGVPGKQSTFIMGESHIDVSLQEGNVCKMIDDVRSGEDTSR